MLYYSHFHIIRTPEKWNKTDLSLNFYGLDEEGMNELLLKRMTFINKFGLKTS